MPSDPIFPLEYMIWLLSSAGFNLLVGPALIYKHHKKKRRGDLNKLTKWGVYTIPLVGPTLAI